MVENWTVPELGGTAEDKAIFVWPRVVSPLPVKVQFELPPDHITEIDISVCVIFAT